MTKKRNNKGFTLVELLCTIVIVLLLTACITVGTGLASKTFGRTFNAVKAKTVSSTVDYLILDELRTATRVKVNNGKLEKYRSENYGEDAAIKIGTNENNLGRLYVETTDQTDTYNAAKNVYVLGTSRFFGDTLQVKTFDVGVAGNIFTVNYEIVDKNHPDSPLVKKDYQVRYIMGAE